MNYGVDYMYREDHYKLEFDDITEFKKVKSEIYDSTYDYISRLIKWTSDDIELLQRFSIYVNFLSRCVSFPDLFIKKYNVKEYHIGLIKRMYIDYDDEQYDDEEISCHLGVKRPYGNSSVHSDIYEQYSKYIDIDLSDYSAEDIADGEAQYDWVDNNTTFLDKIHEETMEIFSQAVNELSLNSLEYVKLQQFGGFEPTKFGEQEYKRELRISKLERIIN